jgi:hypothetical protein
MTVLSKSMGWRGFGVKRLSGTGAIRQANGEHKEFINACIPAIIE